MPRWLQPNADARARASAPRPILQTPDRLLPRASRRTRPWWRSHAGVPALRADGLVNCFGGKQATNFSPIIIWRRLRSSSLLRGAEEARTRAPTRRACPLHHSAGCMHQMPGFRWLRASCVFVYVCVTLRVCTWRARTDAESAHPCLHVH